MSDTQIVSGLDAIESLVATPIVIDFVLNGRQCRLKARHLKPWENELIRVQRDAVQPKIKYGKTPEEDRFDTQNPEFVKQRGELEISVRAQAVFWGVEDFQKKHADLAKRMHDPSARAEIQKVVQASLVDDALNIIASKIMLPDINVSEQVNFSSPDGSSATQP